MFQNFIEKLQTELSKELPGEAAQKKMAPSIRNHHGFEYKTSPRDSAVLILFYEENSNIYIIFIKRNEDGKAHSGQVAFPGGKYENEDKDLKTTALRETFEEIGIPENEINIIGELTSLYIPVSNFRVKPFVGYLSKKPNYNINNHEVQRIITAEIFEFFNDKNISEIELIRNELKIQAPYFGVINDKVWGATAMILSELYEIIKKINLNGN